MQTDWHEIFEYDSTSKTFLRWKNKFRLGRAGKPVSRINDAQAGNISSEGRPCVGYGGKVYSTCKIVWELFNGPIPENREVMFIDGDSANCAIENLELNFVIDKNEYKYGAYLAEFFYYDETSPSGLRWKRLYNKGSNAKIGDVVGSNDKGYWRVHALGTHFKAHKIVWALNNKFENQEGLHIDHIDGNPSNNKIENLRLVEQYLNARNKPMLKRSAVCGQLA
ncbi:hypothetical protein D3C85_474710 [compost metagenome]